MNFKDSCIVVTGAASGIGKGLANKFAALGASHVICADIDADGAARTAAEIGGIAKTVDVASEDSIQALIETVETQIAPIAHCPFLVSPLDIAVACYSLVSVLVCLLFWRGRWLS